jgi:hypothetical protein
MMVKDRAQAGFFENGARQLISPARKNLPVRGTQRKFRCDAAGKASSIGFSPVVVG